jgi:hypothetical protein
MTGTIGILNVGAGDTKLSFDPKKPEEVKRAGAVVADMLKRGFAILVQVGKRKGEPLYMRATGFDPKTSEYIIVGVPDEADAEDSGEEEAAAAAPPVKIKGAAKAGRKETRIKAERTSAVAVSRSAGG